ncbi:MAG: hypothetical protein ACI9GW_001650 [Halieaceae bacterium]
MIRTLVAIVLAFQISFAYADLNSDVKADIDAKVDVATTIANAKAKGNTSIADIYRALVLAGVPILDALSATIEAESISDPDSAANLVAEAINDSPGLAAAIAELATTLAPTQLASITTVFVDLGLGDLVPTSGS